jgi:hypothetical protein
MKLQKLAYVRIQFRREFLVVHSFGSRKSVELRMTAVNLPERDFQCITFQVISYIILNWENILDSVFILRNMLHVSALFKDITDTRIKICKRGKH